MSLLTSALVSLLLVQAQAARGAPNVISLVSGRVLATDSAEPLASAAVRLIPEDNSNPAASGPRGGNRLQDSSDEMGRFSLRGVPPGRYRISVDREGYIHEEHFQFGPNQPVQSVLTINSGQNLENVTVLMTPVPTISGVTYSPRGERLAGVSVQAFRVMYTPSGRKLARVASVLSHEGGEYRLFGLNPGYYYVGASLSSETRRSWSAQVNFTPNLVAPDEGYANVFFRSEDDIAHAQFVHLLDNRSAANVDISFHDVNYFKLSVNIIQDPLARPLLNPTVALIPAGIDLSSARDFQMKRTGSVYTLNRIVGGDYVVVASADYLDSSNTRITLAISQPRSIHIDANSEITIQTVEPIDIPGRLQLTGPLRPPAPIVELVRADYYSSQTFTATLNENGTFQLPLISPGIYDVFVSGLPGSTYISDARLTAADRPLQHIIIDSQQPSRFLNLQTSNWTSNFPLLISVSRSVSTISGTVTNAGRPIPGAKVVLIPVLEQSRLRKDRFLVSESDASGKFAYQGIPAEPYLAFAFEKVESEVYYDAEFIAQIMSRAAAIPVNGRDAENFPLVLITLDDLARLVR